MKTIHKNSLFALTMIVLVLLQLAAPVTAFADDDPPPAPTEPTVVTPTPDPTETVPSEADPSTPDASSSPTLDPIETGTPAPNDSDVLPATPSDSTITEPPADGTNESQVPLLETVQTVSDTTNVVVLDENGNPVPLVSQEAAEIVSTGLPIWCPAGQPPTPDANGCTGTFASLSDLVERFVPTGNGTIWIPSGSDSSSTVSINGSTTGNWSTASSFSLTLQGGWNGVSGEETIGSNSVFSNSIMIYNWNNDVTINNITLNGPNSPEIVVSNPGTFNTYNMNITVNHVEVSNGVNGAGLVTQNGNIVINDSNFSNNSLSGLYTNTGNGNININNSTFYHNGFDNPDLGTGITISGNPGEITINNSTFDSNNKGIKSIGYDLTPNLNINNSSFTQNRIAISFTCGIGIYGAPPTITLKNVVFKKNSVDITTWGCNLIYIQRYSTIDMVISGGSQSEIMINCAESNSVTVILPNGDLVQLFCPVSGKAKISRLDNTSLPMDLPEGFTYASSFNLEILQGVKNDTPISVITEGGSIKASFDASHLQPGAEYSILYFDEATSTWIPLKDFMLDENGNTLSFSLIPDDPAETPREIISGVNLVTKDGIPRVEVSTNFPGTFVLVQR